MTGRRPRIGIIMVLMAFMLFRTNSGFGQVDSAAAWQLLKSGDSLIEDEFYLEALPYFQEALPYFREKKEHLHEFHLLFWLGEIYYIAGDYQQALAVSLTADSLARYTLSLESLENYAQLLVNLGVFNSALGDLDGSLYYYRKAFSFAQKHYGRESQQVVDAYFSLGAVYKHLGQIQKSIALTDTSAQLAQRIGYQAGQAAAYNNLAFIYSDLNDLSKAITYQERAMEYVDNRVDSAVYLNNLGTFLVEVGALDQAILTLERSLELRRAMYPEGHPFLGSTLLNLGSAYFYKEDYQSTLEVTKTIQDGFDPDQPGNAYNLQLAYIHEGSVRFALGEYQKAEICARKSLELPEENGRPSSYFVLANALLEQGRLVEGLEAIQQGIVAEVVGFKPENDLTLPNREQVLAYPVLMDLLVCKTKILMELGKQQPKGTFMRDAFRTASFLDDLVSQARLFKQDYVSQELLAADLRDFYSMAVANCADLFTSTGDSLYLERAYYYCARNKSLQISERLSKPAMDTLAGVDPAWVQQERRLKSEIDFIANKLRYRTFFSEDQVAQWDTKLMVLQRQRDELLKKLQEQAPAYFDLVYQSSLATLDELQAQLLAPGRVLLEYFVTTSGFNYVFLVTSSTIRFYRLPAPSDWELMVRQFRESINNQLPDFYDLSLALYQFLLQPLERELEQKNELIIVPDGVLGLIPFELLLRNPMDPESDPDYLLYHYTCRYLFSSKQGLVSEKQGASPKNGRIFALAPSFSNGLVRPVTIRGTDSVYLPALEGNQVEVADLQRRYRGLFLFGRHAQKKSLAWANGYSVLHISTHALIDDQFPAFSHLLLHNNLLNRYEPLYAYELLEKEIETDLVVLSACNTGFGKVLKGQGVASMAGAFTYAGSPDLVVSLWPVRDETTPSLMAYMYRNLEKGMPKAEALRQAKLAFLNDYHGIYAHPYYWAPFIYVGDGNSLYIKPKRHWIQNPMFWLGLVVVFVVGTRLITSRQA